MYLNKHLFSKNYGLGGALSVILFVITGTIQKGYDMFSEARICCEIQEELEKFDPVEIVYRNTWIQGFQNKKNELHERKD